MGRLILSTKTYSRTTEATAIMDKRIVQQAIKNIRAHLDAIEVLLGD